MDQSSKTILLIEDEEDIRIVYAEVLRDAGYRVIEAKDGNMGLERAVAGDWDLMLLDIMLPGMDGLQILKKTKGDIGLQNKPVILLTNLGNESIKAEGFVMGAEGYLIKSEITPDKIVQEVEDSFKKKTNPNV